MQYNTIPHNAIQYNAMQYNIIQRNVMQWNAKRYKKIQYNTKQYNTLVFIASWLQRFFKIVSNNKQLKLTVMCYNVHDVHYEYGISKVLIMASSAPYQYTMTNWAFIKIGSRINQILVKLYVLFVYLFFFKLNILLALIQI